jgi:hypothetical protein
VQLFPDEERLGYAIDACSFIAISENYQVAEQEDIWLLLDGLAGTGRLKTVRLVLDEVKRNNADVYKRLSPWRRRLVVQDRELITAVGPIIRQFPRMSRPWSTHSKADPWLIALARVDAQIAYNRPVTGSTAQLVDTAPASANAAAQLSSANTKSGGGAPNVIAEAGVTLIAGPINTPP